MADIDLATVMADAIVYARAAERLTATLTQLRHVGEAFGSLSEAEPALNDQLALAVAALETMAQALADAMAFLDARFTAKYAVQIGAVL